MSLFDITQIGLDRAISGAAQRQTAIANNLANANTPAYQRQDVDFHSTLRAAFEDLRTAPAAGAAAMDDVEFTTQTDPLAVVRADGNGVDVDVESANLARNGLEYQSLVTVARARTDILRSAMGIG